MREGVLVIAFDRGNRLAANEVTPLERPEQLAELRPARAHAFERAEPEHLAADRRIEQHRALAGRQRVEAGGDEAAHRRRQLLCERRRRLRQRRRELLDEERVPRRGRGELDRPVLTRCSRVRRESLEREPACVRLRQRAERQGRVRGNPAAPSRPGVDELRARKHEDEDRQVAQARRRAARRGRAGSRRPSADPRRRAPSACRARSPR